MLPAMSDAMNDAMNDEVIRLNAALEDHYTIERELGENWFEELRERVGR